MTFILNFAGLPNLLLEAAFVLYATMSCSSTRFLFCFSVLILPSPLVNAHNSMYVPFIKTDVHDSLKDESSKSDINDNRNMGTPAMHYQLMHRWFPKGDSPPRDPPDISNVAKEKFVSDIAPGKAGIEANDFARTENLSPGKKSILKELKDALLNHSPDMTEDLEYIDGRPILKFEKSRPKREVEQSQSERHKPGSETMTIVKPVLDSEGLTKATIVQRQVPKLHDAPSSSTERLYETSYSDWGAWMKCSTSDCNAAGKQMRMRSCFAKRFDAADYEKCSYNNLVEVRPCKPLSSCNKKTSELISFRWSEWSKCSLTCGYGGQQTRRKICFKSDGSGRTTSVKCTGLSLQKRLCGYSVSCPSWDAWAQWSSCSRTCGNGGVMYRSRKCIVRRYITFDGAGTSRNPTVTGTGRRVSIEGPNIVNKNAATPSQMRSSHSTPMSKGTEYQTLDGRPIFIVDAPRSRHLLPNRQPKPTFHQQDSVTEYIDILSCLGIGGSHEEERPCSQNNCPASWTAWATWSPCSSSCGMGISRRRRECDNGTSKGTCVGKKYAYRRCYTPPCWSSWSDWTDCSGECGNAVGRRKRTRKCLGKTFVIPQYTRCEGDSNEVGVCQAKPCPGEEWSIWGPFGECSKSCGGGYRKRSRICRGSKCSGPREGFRRCNDHACPSWSRWTSFSCCSVSCGEGTRQRSRTCRSGDLEATGCNGESLERNECYKPACNASQTSAFNGFKCGIRPSANLKTVSLLRIFGGKRSGAHDWPWQLSWQHRETRSSKWLHFCGATLIHPRWVLTASHCTEESDYVVDHLNPGDNWAVVVGMVKLYEDGVRYFVDRIFIHPKYEYKSVTKNDIALIKLRKMVPITATAMPACMPQRRRPQPGSTCYATGWGYTSADPDASLSLSLREAALPILKFGQCRNLGLYYRYFLDSKVHMCAGNHVTASSDSCTGDSGGPLVCQRNNRWYIGAVTSFGFDDCGTPGHVGIYAPLDTYEPWIRTTINSHTYDNC